MSERWSLVRRAAPKGLKRSDVGWALLITSQTPAVPLPSERFPSSPSAGSPCPPPAPARAVPPLTPPGPGVLDAPHFFGWVLPSLFQCHLPVGKT